MQALNSLLPFSQGPPHNLFSNQPICLHHYSGFSWVACWKKLISTVASLILHLIKIPSIYSHEFFICFLKCVFLPEHTLVSLIRTLFHIQWKCFNKIFRGSRIHSSFSFPSKDFVSFQFPAFRTEKHLLPALWNLVITNIMYPLISYFEKDTSPLWHHSQ